MSRRCRVYWRSRGCELPYGHDGPHRNSGETPLPGDLLYGEDMPRPPGVIIEEVDLDEVEIYVDGERLTDERADELGEIAAREADAIDRLKLPE